MSKKALANAERVADEAIAKLSYLQEVVRDFLDDKCLDREMEPNLWQDLDMAGVATRRLRQELEG